MRSRTVGGEIAEVVNDLPAEFLRPVIYRNNNVGGSGTDVPSSIRDYLQSLDSWLDEHYPGVDSLDVLDAIGLPPSEWYLYAAQSY